MDIPSGAAQNWWTHWHDDVIKWKHFPRYWQFGGGGGGGGFVQPLMVMYLTSIVYSQGFLYNSKYRSPLYNQALRHIRYLNIFLAKTRPTSIAHPGGFCCHGNQIRQILLGHVIFPFSTGAVCCVMAVLAFEVRFHVEAVASHGALPRSRSPLSHPGREKNGCYFADDNLNCICVNENLLILI